MTRRSLAAGLLLAAMIAAPAHAEPGNDDFERATPLLPVAVTRADLNGATTEFGEPRACLRGDTSLGVTVWYRLDTPPGARFLIRSAAPTVHRLAAYDGTTFDDMRVLGCADSFLSVGAEMVVRGPERARVFLQVLAPQGGTVAITLAPVLGGDIEGTVTDTDGQPIPGVCVSAISTGNLRDARGITHSDGTYLISLPPDSYGVSFRPCRDDRFVAEVYDDATSEDPTPVEVGPNETREGIDAVLLRYGLIQGTVSDLEGNPQTRVCIDGWPDGGAPGDIEDTSVQGRFSLKVPPGSYRLNFSSCFDFEQQFVAEWYDDQRSFVDAEVIDVDEGEDITLRHVSLTPRDP